MSVINSKTSRYLKKKRKIYIKKSLEVLFLRVISVGCLRQRGESRKIKQLKAVGWV